MKLDRYLSVLALGGLLTLTACDMGKEAAQEETSRFFLREVLVERRKI